MASDNYKILSNKGLGKIYWGHWAGAKGHGANTFFFITLKHGADTFFTVSGHQGGHWSGKSQGNLIFLQGQGKVREFCRLVREILNTKKVREKSGNFIILAQNMCCSRYFDYLKCEKSVDFFSRSLRSLETMKTC